MHNKSHSPKKKSPSKIDLLNDWNYCNPQNTVDELPQPYRYVNKILQERILGSVYAKIFEIEKFRTDPNYEGHVKSLPPQGSFDISMTMTAGKDNSQSASQTHNHIITGDAYGNIMILDLNKKMRVAKKEVGTCKRIVKVSVAGRDLAQDEQQNVQNIAVIAHLDPVVYLYRYRLGENKLFLQHTFVVSKPNESKTQSKPIGEYPIDIQLSSYSQFLLVRLYNGNILVFKVPDVNQQQKQQPEEEQKVAQPTPKPKQGQIPAQTNQQKQSTFQTPESKSQPILTSQLEVKPTEITEIFYKIEFKGQKKEPKYNDMIMMMKQEIQAQYELMTQQQQQDKKEDPKKKPAAPVKGKEVKVDEQPQQPVEEWESNENDKIINFEKAEDGLDISAPYPPEKFRCYCFFINEQLGVQIGSKAFNQIKSYDVVVGLVVGWTNMNKIEFHQFQTCAKYNLPEYIQQKILQMSEKHIHQDSSQNKSFQQPSPSQPTQPQLILQPIINPPIPKFTPKSISTSLLYPLSCLALSQSSNFLAIGLIQGSIIIFDIPIKQEKYYLDKHQAEVTHLVFCDDWRLVSGAFDGSVHIYDILENGKIIMKRTNQFRRGTASLEAYQQNAKLRGEWGIVDLGVSNSGVAVAIDGQHEVRLYDVWHGEKVAKLNAQQIMDDKIRQWTLWPTPILYCSKYEIISIADYFDQKKEPEEIKTIENTWQKQTSIQIFKIFDNLINLFPALSNVYRRGIEKEKIFHLYSKIDSQSLRDPSFEVPTLQGDQIQNRLQVPTENKSQHLSKKSIKKEESFKSSHHTGQLQKDVLQKIQEENNPSKNQGASLINSLHGSVISDSSPDFNSSFRSHQTKSSGKDKDSQNKNKAGVLTKEMLHPEQFLLEKEKVPVPLLINEYEKVIENCRNRNSDKMVRAEKVNNMIAKLGTQLQQNEEKRILMEKQKKLQTIKTKVK